MTIGVCFTASQAPAVERASHLTGFAHCQGWQKSAAPGQIQWTSPVIRAAINWNQAIVSWNVRPDPGVEWTIEARVDSPSEDSRWLCLGTWSAMSTNGNRQSSPNQKSPTVEVATDTIISRLKGLPIQVRLKAAVPERVVAQPPELLTISFCNTDAVVTDETSQHAHQTILSVPTPQKSQLQYSGGEVWCSPTSVSMVMCYWAKQLRRPELAVDVPLTARGVYDPNWPGTGNWPFNTAWCGSFPGIRAFVTRLERISELEAWIAAGVPVVCSVAYRALKGLSPRGEDGHVVVCTGFTRQGDVVVNDPWTHTERGESVRKVFSRERFAAAWNKTYRTVYLIYPASHKVPRDRDRHWTISNS